MLERSYSLAMFNGGVHPRPLPPSGYLRKRRIAWTRSGSVLSVSIVSRVSMFRNFLRRVPLYINFPGFHVED